MDHQQRRATISLVGATMIVGCVAIGSWFDTPARGTSTVAATISQEAAPYIHVASRHLPERISAPRDVALAPDGTLYIADSRMRRVHVLGADGAFREPIVHPLYDELVPMAIDVDSSRDVLSVVWQSIGSRGRFGAPVVERHDLAGGGLLPGAVAYSPALSLQAEAMSRHEGTGDLFVTGGDRLVRLIRGDVWDDERIIIETEWGYPPPPVQDVAVAGDRMAALIDGAVAIFGLDGSAVAEVETEHTVVALASTAGDDGFVMMVEAEGATPAADDPLLVGLDLDGARDPSADVTVGEAGIAVPPFAEWRSDVVLSGPRIAAIGLAPGDIWAVRRTEPNPITIFARELDLIGDLLEEERLAIPTPHAVAITSGALGVLAASCQGRDEQHVFSEGACERDPAHAYVVSTAGEVSGGTLLSRGLKDIAWGDGGAIFGAHAEVVQDNRRDGIMRYAPHLMRAGEPFGDDEWDVGCECTYGGRLAFEPGRLLTTRMANRPIVAVDPLSGAGAVLDVVGASIGAIPSDLAAGDGGVFVSSAGESIVARIDRDGVAVPVWSSDAGPGEGPLRIARGTWDGQEIVASITSSGAIRGIDAEEGALLFDWRPKRADRSLIDPIDLAIAADGRLLVVDSDGAIEVLEPSAAGWPTPVPTPGPSDPAPCAVFADTSSGPERVVLGETVTVTMSLTTSCEATRLSAAPDVDMVIVVMASEPEGRPRGFAPGGLFTWLRLMEHDSTRFGVVTVDDIDGEISVPLGASIDDVVESFGDRRNWMARDPLPAIAAAIDMLESQGRPDALPVIALVDLNDILLPGAEEEARLAGDVARRFGILTYAVTGTRHPHTALQFAGDPLRFANLLSPKSAAWLLDHLHSERLTAGIVDVALVEHVGARARFEPGTAWPPLVGDAMGPELRWERSVLSSVGHTVTYRARPIETGRIALSDGAIASFTDADGVRREVAFPIPFVEVVAEGVPPEATPTAFPGRVMLPFVER